MAGYEYVPYDCDIGDDPRRGGPTKALEERRADYFRILKQVGSPVDMIYCKAKEEGKIELDRFLRKKTNGMSVARRIEWEDANRDAIAQVYQAMVCEFYVAMSGMVKSYSSCVVARKDPIICVLEPVKTIVAFGQILETECDIDGLEIEPLLLSEKRGRINFVLNYPIDDLDRQRIFVMQMSGFRAQASRARVCVRCDRELLIGLNSYSPHQNLCHSCVYELDFDDPGDVDHIFDCAKCGHEIDHDECDVLSYLCLECSFVVVQMSNVSDLLQMIGCSEPFDDECIQRLYTCNNQKFSIPVTAIVLTSDELGALGTLEVIKSVRNVRNAQLRFLCDQIGLSLSYAKQKLLCDLSLSMIAEYIYGVRKRWGKTPISDWLLGIQVSEFAWGSSTTSYQKILAYIPEGSQSILDFGCGSGDGVVQIRKSFPSACVVGYDIEDQLNPLNECQFVSEIDEFYDVVIVNNVIHHVIDVNSFIMNLRRCIGPRTTLIVKDHVVTNYNLLLVVLLHVCHSGGLTELMIFRSISWFVGLYDAFGLSVIVREHKNDVGDTIFVGQAV